MTEIGDVAERRAEAERLFEEELAEQELAAFLDYLKVQGQGDLLSWLLEEGMADWFGGPEAADARAWLFSLEDEDMRKVLAETAGREMVGQEEEFRRFVGALGNIHVQSRALTGYCAAFARDHPEQAVSKFMELRPDGVDASGVSEVMRALPEDTGFGEVGMSIPTDDKSLAKNARRALLENWAGKAPEEAADYVMQNTRTVHADQVRAVVESWLETAPDAAVAWADQLPPGEYRDYGYMARAAHFQKDELGRAWAAAEKIEDMDRRVEAAKPLYELWAHRDPKGAERAWLEMFPQSEEE